MATNLNTEYDEQSKLLKFNLTQVDGPSVGKVVSWTWEPDDAMIIGLSILLFASAHGGKLSVVKVSQ